MCPTQAEIDKALDAARHGNEGALRTVVELGGEVLPRLSEAFHRESDPFIKAKLLKLMWEQRNPNILPILEGALHEANHNIWREALNGLVTLASPKSALILEQAINDQSGRKYRGASIAEWIKEAHEQVREQIKKESE